MYPSVDIKHGLLAAVVPLQTEKPVVMWLGRAAQAWLLHEIERHDAALSTRLHKGTQSRRPYTVYVSPQSLRITSVDSELSVLLRDVILPTMQNLILAGNELKIVAGSAQIE